MNPIIQYSYDLAGRLISVARNAMILSSYQYDSNGNRVSGVVSGMPFNATYDNQDRMITFTNPEASALTSVTTSFSTMVASTDSGKKEKIKKGRGHAYGPCNNPSNRGPRFNGNNGRSQDGCSGGSDVGGSDGGSTDGGTVGGTDGGSTDGGTVGGTDGGSTDGGTVGGTDGGSTGGSTGGGTTGGYGVYSYNDNGELVSVSKESGTTTFLIDNLSQLKEVKLSEKLIAYALDWNGRRVARTVNGVISGRRIYESSLQLSAEVGPNGGIKEYVYGTNINSADYMKVDTDTYRIVKDHLGSPRLVVKVTDGTIVQRMDYNEWGEVFVDTNPGFQAFGYAGGLYDPDTKLVKFGARDYDGRIGRWLSKDPIGFNGGDANLYGYVLNDPVNFIDPSGKIWGKVAEFLVKQVGKRIYRKGVECLSNIDPLAIPNAGEGSDQVPGYPAPGCNPGMQSCAPGPQLPLPPQNPPNMTPVPPPVNGEIG